MVLSRRTFLTTALAGGAAAAVTAGCSGGASSGAVAAGTGAPPSYVPFAGPHQTGVTHPGNEYGLMAAFTVTAEKQADLADTFQAITAETRRIMEGQPLLCIGIFGCGVPRDRKLVNRYYAAGGIGGCFG